MTSKNKFIEHQNASEVIYEPMKVMLILDRSIEV